MKESSRKPQTRKPRSAAQTLVFGENAPAARLRQTELLRIHRPKFNKVNTCPKAYSFVWLKYDCQGLELGRTNEPEAGPITEKCKRTRSYLPCLRLPSGWERQVGQRKSSAANRT